MVPFAAVGLAVVGPTFGSCLSMRSLQSWQIPWETSVPLGLLPGRSFPGGGHHAQTILIDWSSFWEIGQAGAMVT